MNGFAGFVDYSLNFLFEMPDVTKCLWKMADVLEGGVKYGIDVLEDTGAFIQNSRVPIKTTDYYFRTGEDVYYLFSKGLPRPGRIMAQLALAGGRDLCEVAARIAVEIIDEFDGPFCGVLFAPGQKELLLFRSPKGAPVYYDYDCNSRGGAGLIFATSQKAISIRSPKADPEVLSPGTVAAFGLKGLEISFTVSG